MQKEQLLYWSGMTDTEHSTTSSSNKEDEGFDWIWNQTQHSS